MKSFCRLAMVGWLAAVSHWPAEAVQTAVISWASSSDASVSGYNIYYGSSSRQYMNVVDAGRGTNITVSGLIDGSTNYFAATTYDSTGDESTLSEEIVVITKAASVVTPPVPPVVVPQLSAVANLVASTNADDPQSMTLSWTADANSAVAGYRIYWGTNSDIYYNAVHVGQVSSLVLTGLVANTTYYFMVRERDAGWNEGPISSEASCFLPPIAKLENVPPTLNPLANLTLNMNSATQSVVLEGISCGAVAEGQTVKVSAVSSNPKLIALKNLSYTNSKTSGVLFFKPVANATGTATISVTVNDGGSENNVVTQSFTVTVVNQALLAAMPKITRQVSGSVALAGQPCTLSVGVSGKAPFKYQWKLNGKNISGATSSTLSFKKVKTAQAGKYSVSISNSAGATNSVTATLNVVTNPAPTITMSAIDTQSSQPVAKAVAQGPVGAQFGVQIEGVSGAQYVVQGSSDLKNWTSLITNVAPFTFSEANVASFNQRYYRSFYKP